MKNSSAGLNQFLINRLIFFMIHICSSFYTYMVCTKMVLPNYTCGICIHGHKLKGKGFTKCGGK